MLNAKKGLIATWDYFDLEDEDSDEDNAKLALVTGTNEGISENKIGCSQHTMRDRRMFQHLELRFINLIGFKESQKIKIIGSETRGNKCLLLRIL